MCPNKLNKHRGQQEMKSQCQECFPKVKQKSLRYSDEETGRQPKNIPGQNSPTQDPTTKTTAQPRRQSNPRIPAVHWEMTLGLTLKDGSTPIINVGHLLQLGPFADVLQEGTSPPLFISAQLGLLGICLEEEGYVSSP